MSELPLRERLEKGVARLDAASERVRSLSQDSLTREWLKELEARKKLLVGQLQLMALEETDSLAQIVEDKDESGS